MMGYVGDDNFIFSALVSKIFRTAWDVVYGVESRSTQVMNANITEERLRVALIQGYPKDNVCDVVAEKNEISLMGIARESGCPWSQRTFVLAMRTCSLSFAETMHAWKCPWNEEAFAVAAGRGDFGLIHFLFVEGCPMSALITASAAENRRWLMLKHLVRWGCPVDERACIAAARCGRMGTFSLVVQQSSSCGVQTADEVACCGSVRMMGFLRRRGVPMGVTSCRAAGVRGYFPMLRFMMKHGVPYGKWVMLGVLRPTSNETIEWIARRQFICGYMLSEGN